MTGEERDELLGQVRDVVRAELDGYVEPRLLSTGDAARALGISPRFVQTLIADGRLRSLRVESRRLIPVAALDEFVAQLDRDQAVAS